jgi:two-component system, LytTR family, sensor kinase
MKNLYKKTHWLFDLNNRIYVHLLFWASYYAMCVNTYIEIYDYTIQVQFLELPAKMLAVYVNLYLLMPYFLKQNKLFFYVVCGL